MLPPLAFRWEYTRQLASRIRGSAMNTLRRTAHLLHRSGTLGLLLVLFTLTAFGQSNKGTLKGTVSDQSGGVVQNATVTVTNNETNIERTVSTGDDGNYEAPLLDPGNYRVSVSAPTFSTSTHESVTIQTGSTQRLDISLTP